MKYEILRNIYLSPDGILRSHLCPCVRDLPDSGGVVSHPGSPRDPPRPLHQTQGLSECEPIINCITLRLV